jgi:hypothetical protein
MGAFVVYDSYWDPVASYADEQEAKRLCEPGQEHAGCHVLFSPEARPGDLSSMPYVSKPWDD